MSTKKQEPANPQDDPQFLELARRAGITLLYDVSQRREWKETPDGDQW